MTATMRRYWTYQLAGWVGYSIIGISINVWFGTEVGPLLVSHAVFIGAGIGLTHLLRREILRRWTPGKSFTKFLGFLSLGTLLISVVLAVLVIGTDSILTGSKWDPVSMGALWWGMFVVTGMWTTLYVRIAERRRLAVQESQLRVSLQEAQLRALEAQINPHFLFNSLNSIRALVTKDPDRAQDMITRLSNVLRSSLRHDQSHLVLLREEWEAMLDYLALEGIRFGERLHASTVMDEAAAECLIPPMVLQTLAENAIKHGIARLAGSGDVRIRAVMKDRQLVLTVANTGSLDSPGPDSNRMGLDNIRERLNLLYGDRAKLKLEQEGGMVNASLAIPASA